MSGISKKLMGTTAAAGGGPLAIEDVFSTYLWTGTNSENTITNGIDLAGEGGLIWTKWRSITNDHVWVDTERGALKVIKSHSAAGEVTNGNNAPSSFLSNGFTYTDNGSGFPIASWTFRKAPRFFDVVTYTGNGVAGRVINHSLGCDVGTVIIKQTNASRDWAVWHRSGGVNPGGKLNSTEAFGYTWVSSTSTTSITLENEGIEINGSGQTYVAYLFAHDPLGPSGDGSDGLIACGSYTGTGAAGNVVSLGWEPQWVLIKSASTGDTNWQIYDTMRGWVNGSNDSVLYPNASTDEQTAASGQPEATGFTAQGALINTSGQTYIYIAIRRGPMRAPTSGTEVFATQAYTGDNTFGRYLSGVAFPPDAFWATDRDGYEDWYNFDRLRGAAGKELKFNSTAAEGAYSDDVLDSFTMDGIRFDTTQSSILNGSSGIDYISYFLRRAPGFFDVVAYTGNGVAGRTVPHNLGVAPEMMIIKGRTDTENWRVFHAGLPTPADDFLYLNATDATVTSIEQWNSTLPTATEFSLSGTGRGVNDSVDTYIAYLFATLPGISKVGSYTGNGSSQTINCGFTSGARFVMIKSTNVTGDWNVYDTARGIVAGNDPYLAMNTTAAENTSWDLIDPASSGFVVNNNNSAPAAGEVNALNVNYIFLAIA